MSFTVIINLVMLAGMAGMIVAVLVARTPLRNSLSLISINLGMGSAAIARLAGEFAAPWRDLLLWASGACLGALIGVMVMAWSTGVFRLREAA